MRVGIGAGVETARIASSIARVSGRLEAIVYSGTGSITAPSGCEVIGSSRPWETMVCDLAEGRIDAAVRGSLPANETLGALKRCMGVQALERIALLETFQGQKFLLAPVGVDEGWTILQKISLIEKARLIAPALELLPGVAVISGGRLGDAGRHSAVDRSLADAELVARLTGAEHRGILIEEAIGRCGTILAPDGIAGNLIFRTLIHLGGGRSHGAPVVNIERIFVDTSRASPDYSNALLLAASLANKFRGGIKRQI